MPPLQSLQRDLPSIDASFLQFCASHGIFSVEDFLVHDLQRLVAFAECQDMSKDLKKGIAEVLFIIDSQHQPWLNGMELLGDARWNKIIFSTGCEGIDLLLQGGLRGGQLTELVGPSSSGKTQVCLQAASHIAHKYMGTVMFLDTSNSFSPKRVACLVSHLLNPSVKEVKERTIKRVMSNILCYSVFDIFMLLDVLHQLEFKLRSQVQIKNADTNLHLLVVDSFSSLITAVLGGKGSHGHSLMVSAGFLLKKLANEHNLAVLVWSISVHIPEVLKLQSCISTSHEQFASVENEWGPILNEKIIMKRVNQGCFKSKIIIIIGSEIIHKVTNHMVGGEGGVSKPALGESWKTIPHVRLLLSHDHGSNFYNISILKHTCKASGQVGRFLIPN